MKEFSYKAAVVDLIYLQDQVERLIIKYPKYADIAQILCKHDYLDDNNKIPLPTVTSVSRETGIKFPKIKKQIKEIHDLIFSATDNNLSFDNVQYRICFSFQGNHFEFKLNNLPVIPRIGENLDIPFIKAQISTDLFYVEGIDHVFDKGIQIVEIWCKSGRGNQYLQFRKDKAECLREISFDELPKIDNYELEKRIRNGKIQQ